MNSRYTALQREITQLIALGHTHKAIGKKLDMAPQTVSLHCKVIQQKGRDGGESPPIDAG